MKNYKNHLFCYILVLIEEISMRRGRPVFSQIRQNLVEILFVMGKGYGYNIYKTYIAIFPKTRQTNVYYQLKRGVDLDIFAVDKIETEKGEFSWGNQATKTYYKLGPSAKPAGMGRVREYFESLKLSEESK